MGGTKCLVYSWTTSRKPNLDRTIKDLHALNVVGSTHRYICATARGFSKTRIEGSTSYKNVSDMGFICREAFNHGYTNSHTFIGMGTCTYSIFNQSICGSNYTYFWISWNKSCHATLFKKISRNSLEKQKI